MTVSEIRDLAWYFGGDAEAELGVRAAFDPSSNDHGTTSLEQRFPTWQMVRAASRYRLIRAVLVKLHSREQSALEAAYLPIRVPPQLRSQYGAAAGLVVRAQQHAGEHRRELVAAVADAERSLTRAVNGSVDAAKAALASAKAALAAHREQEEKIPGIVTAALDRAQTRYRDAGGQERQRGSGARIQAFLLDVGLA